MSVAGFEVDFERSAHLECLVGPDRVEQLPVGLDLATEVEAVVDLGRVKQQLAERPAGQPLCLGERLLDRLDSVAVVGRCRDVPAELELRPVVGDPAE